ncbi:unnamed protein product [Acanthosepion pharaonis]|uniref:Uncharacterized protein n=1 Tax=Acanthosepion pharaonis TaxID=158019 RepID=A0A812DYB2_ACAPH|nr:unnamed protein product [Sepia pharaonis]
MLVVTGCQVNMKMTAVNSSSVQIPGALILRISGSALFNIKHQTRQIFYFTFSTDKLFVSKQICDAHGITSPTSGENVLPNTGFLHAAADAISCHSVGDPTPPDDITIMVDATEPLNHNFLLQFFLKDIRMAQQDDTQVCSPSATTEVIQPITLGMVRVATSINPNRLMEMIEEGIPENCNKPRQFFQFCDGFLILYHDRIVPTISLLNQILQELHLAYQGIKQMCPRVEDSFFWLGCSSNRMAHSQSNATHPAPPNVPGIHIPEPRSGLFPVPWPQLLHGSIQEAHQVIDVKCPYQALIHITQISHQVAPLFSFLFRL